MQKTSYPVKGKDTNSTEGPLKNQPITTKKSSDLNKNQAKPWTNIDSKSKNVQKPDLGREQKQSQPTLKKQLPTTQLKNQRPTTQLQKQRPTTSRTRRPTSKLEKERPKTSKVAKPIGGMPKFLLYEDFKREKYYNMPCKPKWNKYKSDYEKKWSVRIFTKYKIVDNENSLKTNRLMIGKFLIFNDRKSQSVLVCQGDYLSLSGEKQDKKNELEDGRLEKWVYSVKDDAWSKKIDDKVHTIYKREGALVKIYVIEPLLHLTMTLGVDASDTIEKVKAKIQEKDICKLIPPEQQRLFMQSNDEMKDDRTLASYKIKNESTFHLAFKFS